VGDLRRVIARGEPVAPDDGYHDHPLHAGPLAGLLQVAGRGGEELRGRLLVGRGLGGDVDYALHARQSLRQTVTDDHVHAQGTRHPDDVVSLGLEHVDDMTADRPGRPRYRELLLRACLHDYSPPEVSLLNHLCAT
jgi:hypothetical protein